MIYDFSYFKNELFIPNLNSDGSDIVSDNEKILELMQFSDVKFLTDCFSYEFSKEILESVNSNGEVNSSASQLIKDLIDGDAEHNWLGLRFEINGIKMSVMANYTYCQYLVQKEKSRTVIGSVKNESQSGIVASNWSDYVQAWNQLMVFRQINYVDYQYNLTNFGIKLNKFGVSLQEYILNKQELNTENFKLYEKVNSFGI